MLREALAFVQSRFLGERVIKYPDRAEAERFYNFPYEALEEALANAVYHRGYDVREPIEVRISPEEIVVVNYPGPDRAVRLDQLLEQFRNFCFVHALSFLRRSDDRRATIVWQRRVCVKADGRALRGPRSETGPRAVRMADHLTGR
jgi:hypothetical protein